LAFANFEPKRVAKYSARDVNRLLGNEGIVRHRGKIEATINNARATLKLQQEVGSLAKFVWSFCPENSSNTKRRTPKKNTDIAVSTQESEALSKALRGMGFAFVGPTTMYALMQSVGLVNDHFEGCWVRAECEKKRVIALKKMLA
jgi:DNA-3-methyladenine glycosylase I